MISGAVMRTVSRLHLPIRGTSALDPHEMTPTRTWLSLPALAAAAVGVGVGLCTTSSAWVIAGAAALTLAIAHGVTHLRWRPAPAPDAGDQPPARRETTRTSPPSVEASVGLFDRTEPAPTVQPVFAMRILLAGPDPAATTGLLAVLRGALADVVVAHGAAAVVETATRAATGQDGPLDAMLIAMHMEGSVDTVARLRADGFTGPILGLCGRAGSPSAARCRQAGCSAIAPDHITGAPLMREFESLFRRHIAR